MKTASCRSCGSPVIWAVNERTKKRAPIDATPVVDGPAIFTHNPGQGGDPEYRVLTKQERADGVTGDRFTAHHQTCPQGKAWKRGAR